MKASFVASGSKAVSSNFVPSTNSTMSMATGDGLGGAFPDSRRESDTGSLAKGDGTTGLEHIVAPSSSAYE